MEEDKTRLSSPHCLVVSYPVQGHFNPMLQFSKRLSHRGVRSTLATPLSLFSSFSSDTITPSYNISVETISDGYDQGGIRQAETPQAYLRSLRQVGSLTLTQLVERLNGSGGDPVSCIVYDGFLPWCLDVAKRFGLVSAVFFTQSSAVGSVYFHVHEGIIEVPLVEEEYFLPGMPPLRPKDLPSLVYDVGSYPSSLEMVVAQFSNVDGADWVLCNTFAELEPEVVDWQAKKWPALRTIGPTVPSMYLDKQLKEDTSYGFNIFKPSSQACLTWLNEKPTASVVYVSFGSLSRLGEKQMEEISLALRNCGSYFIWVVKSAEEGKLPKDFASETKERGLVVNWAPQLDLLAHKAVGCFVTHCGWNSILEALCFGVPMVAMPQWTDQPTNAKLVQDVWKMGLRPQPDEKGIVHGQALVHSIMEIMEGEVGKEIRMSSQKWKRLAKSAVDKGGSSDRNIVEFVASLLHS